MSGPNDTDDGWAELARELGLEQSRPTPPAPDSLRGESPRYAPETSAESDDDFAPTTGNASEEADQPGAYVDEADVDEFDADLADQPAEVGEGGEPGDPDEPKKKRRRRRRRRKKGGVNGEPVVEGVAAAGDELDDDADAEADEADTPEQRVEEELPSPEASREMIANWDVPSWETIINTMLYRPGGR